MIEACDPSDACSNFTLGGSYDNFTVDNTYPLIDYATSTEANRTNISQSNIFVNVSVTETNEANITFKLYNSTEVNSTTYTDGTRTINWTDLSDGTYTYNVTLVDSAGNTNSTSTRTITLDTTDPVITLTSPADLTSSTTSEYNFTFSVNDSNSISNCSLILDGSIINTLTDVNNTGGTNGMYNSSLAATSHTWSVNCTDIAGNLANSSTRTLIVSSPSPSGGSSQYLHNTNRHSDNNVLELRMKIEKNSFKELNIQNNKGTNINKITINSKNYISGEIKISNLDITPDCLTSKFLEDKLIYRTLQIDSDINNEDLESVSLLIDIERSWLEKNQIDIIGSAKCSPSFNVLKSSLITKKEDLSSYSFSSDGFSTWVIYGVKEIDSQPKEEKIDNNQLEEPNENESPKTFIEQDKPNLCFQISKLCWYWWLISAIFLISIAAFTAIYHKKIYHKKNKKKTKK